MRPEKDEYYLEIAKAIALKSPCTRRRFGAIIVVNDTIVSTGYNGPARGVINCEEIGCLKDLAGAEHYKSYEFCTAVHAEENAIINAARSGSRVMGGNLYVVATYPDGKMGESRPCDRCSRAIINAGITKVITVDENGDLLVYNPHDWIKKDTEWYKSEVERMKKEKEITSKINKII
jgi:dCMP deaminase